VLGLVNNRDIWICGKCGFGYKSKELAYECERFCSTYRACSIEITKKAIYVPKRPLKIIEKTRKILKSKDLMG